MGDYGFEGAGEFGGRDENFNCLPDYHFSKCPNLTNLKDLKFSRKEYCKLALMAIEEQEPSPSILCNFYGDSYKECPRYIESKNKENKA